MPLRPTLAFTLSLLLALPTLPAPARAQIAESIKADPATGALLAPTGSAFKSANHLAIGVDIEAYNATLAAIATAGAVPFSLLTGLPTTVAGLGLTDALTPAQTRGGLREAELWDDFQRADSSGTAGAAAPSGQTYIYLNQPVSGLPSLVSNELVNSNITSSGNAYYLEVQLPDPIRNIGCTGRFVTGPSPSNSGYTQGVLLLTDAINSYLPQNLIHCRWFFNELILEVSNSSVAGLRRVGTLALNAPLGEVAAVQLVLDGASCTVTAAGQSATFYDSAFAETAWTVAIYEEIGSGSGADYDNWHFDSIWANAPVAAIPGLTAQPRSAKLDAVALGLGALLGSAQTFTANQTIADGLTLSLYGSHGTPGTNLRGGIQFNSSGGATDNWFVASDLFHADDFGTLSSSANAGNPGVPIIYSRSDLDQTTIGHNAASQPSLGYTLNIEGTLNAGDLSCATLAITGTTAVPPTNTATPAAWLTVTVAGTIYKIPLFQ